MKTFNTGNVIKTPDNMIVIVTDCNDESVRWIPLDYANSCGSSKLKDYTREENCDCYFNTEGTDNDGSYDSDCEKCKGNGYYKVEIKGYGRSKILATTVKEYILKGLTKNFGW